jgi:hypothetical protein
MSYAVSGVRRALYGGALPEGVGLPGSTLAIEIGVVAFMAIATLALATVVSSRRPAA